jgi:prepilin-type N-terminal cleavage/methylation domain-containing protein
MNKSFTLIEILVVIVVIGALSAFILVGMSSITNSANIAKSQAFSNSLRNSLLLNLVSEWKLDGNGNDSWGVNNGTLVGATHLPVLKTNSDCFSGSCYDFDGTEDYINVGSRANLTTDISNGLTITAWIYPELISGDSRTIIGFSGGNAYDRNYFFILMVLRLFVRHMLVVEPIATLCVLRQE